MTKEQLLFCLLRTEITGEKMAHSVDGVSKKLINDTLQLAQFHSVMHLVTDALVKNALVSDESMMKLCEQYSFSAASEDSRQNYETEQLKTMLLQSNIPFILLKGAVLQHLYPETWMRNSCDVDVLVREEDLERAISLLTEKMGYVLQSRGAHDVSLVLGNTHIELHYNLMEEGRAKRSFDVLCSVWDSATAVGDTCEFVMSDEMFYFYHIAHMAKHMHTAGCGVRNFIDIWILNHRVGFAAQARRDLLAKGGLLTFADAVSALAEVWLSGAEHTALTRDLERFVLYSGTYGSMQSRVAVSRSKKGNVAYCLSRVFLPYKSMCLSYPQLQRRPILLPIYWVRRIVRILATDTGRTNVRTEVAVNVKKTYISPEEIGCLMHSLDL